MTGSQLYNLGSIFAGILLKGTGQDMEILPIYDEYLFF